MSSEGTESFKKRRGELKQAKSAKKEKANHHATSRKKIVAVRP